MKQIKITLLGGAFVFAFATSGAFAQSLEGTAMSPMPQAGMSKFSGGLNTDAGANAGSYSAGVDANVSGSKSLKKNRGKTQAQR